MTGFGMQQELEFKQAMVLTGGCCCTSAKKNLPLFFVGALQFPHEFFNHVGSFFLSNVGDLGGFESLVRLSERWIL
jgi:hypothetical protein